MLVVQNARKPAAIRNAVVDIIQDDLTRIDIAVAYVTKSGVELIDEAVRAHIRNDDDYKALPKRLIAALDFGITEPEALIAWQKLPKGEVRVVGADRILRGSLIPLRAYHPKLYAFTLGTGTCNTLIGSANLTSRGWSVNTEAGWTQRGISSAEVTAALDEVLRESVLLTDEILLAYTKLRSRTPRPRALQIETERVLPPKLSAGAFKSFKEAIATKVNPAHYDSLWVQGDGMQGGSHNQLELPRGANRFFGFAFTGYARTVKVTIGVPVLRSGRKKWTDRILSWHGDNRMERINLPTHAKGGFKYENSAVMFRRLSDGSFELIVTDWNSDLARSWRQASADAGAIYRLGRTASNRLVGLI